MPPDRQECPKCGRRMQVGYFLDSKHGERRGLTEWVDGTPERSFWMGLKIKGHYVLPVTVYRCERCGLLESYALPAS
ncbi:MAG: PF20097 family protein [Gemmatimonadaceae bacterium]